MYESTEVAIFDYGEENFETLLHLTGGRPLFELLPVETLLSIGGVYAQG